MAAPSEQTLGLSLALPAGKLGIGIQVRAADGMCVVTSKSNADSPLEVRDVIVSINGIELKSEADGDEKVMKSWIKLFAAFSSGPRNVVVRREEKNDGTEAEDGARENTTSNDDGGADVNAAAATGKIPDQPASEMNVATATSNPAAEAETSNGNDTELLSSAGGKENGAAALETNRPTTAVNIADENCNVATTSTAEDPACNEPYSPSPEEIERTRKGMSKATGQELSEEETLQFMKSTHKIHQEVKAGKARIAARHALNKPPTREEVEEGRTGYSGRELSEEDLVEFLMKRTGASREVAIESVKKYPPNRDGHVAPLDIVAQKDKYPALFEEFVGFSDRFTETMSNSAKNRKLWPIDENGYCTRILEADFAKTLKPFAEQVQRQLPFTNDSNVNRFSEFVVNMFWAAETGSTGGDACRQNRVLLAALSDVERMPNHKERIEHLLGFTMAIRWHGLYATLTRGHPPLLRDVFKGIADQWKKFFDPKYDHSCYNLCERFRELADGHCKALQEMLKANKKENGEWCENYNFNYKRIPRPKKVNAKENTQVATNVGAKRKASAGNSNATKRKKPTEVDRLIERILAIKNVPEDRVYDSAPEVRRKIKEFLRRDGVTKAKFCEALGSINSNSLKRFLDAEDQKQSGNQTYRKGYIFFEKLRILEEKAKSSERVVNEEQMPSGFDFSRPKGGRPGTVFYDPRLRAMGY